LLSENRKSTNDLAVRGASPALCSSVNAIFDCNIDNNNKSNNSQDIEFSEKKELENKFEPKKRNNIILRDSYKRIGYLTKSNRVSDCGSFLEFAHEISDFGDISKSGKLHNANFCRDRLCPMCSWRRSYKIFGQVSQIMEHIYDDYTFLFLTLTVPNVHANELSVTLDHLFSSWNRFTGYKKIKRIMLGFFRALEITYNEEKDTFHPHFHIVLAVPHGYIKSRDYLTRNDFLSMWRKACKDESITQVDIRVCRTKRLSDDFDFSMDEWQRSVHTNDARALSSVVAEISKYAVKDNDYLFPEDLQLTDYLVKTFCDALFHRRLVQFGGIFKETFRTLQLEDVENENADLIHINSKLNPALSWMICRYNWGIGAYKFARSFVESPSEHGAKR